MLRKKRELPLICFYRTDCKICIFRLTQMQQNVQNKKNTQQVALQPNYTVTVTLKHVPPAPPQTENA